MSASTTKATATKAAPAKPRAKTAATKATPRKKAAPRVTTIKQGGADKQFSERTVPWMKYGELKDRPVTAVEAAKLGGLDFAVDMRPTAYLDASGEWVEITNRKSVVRADTGTVFEVVSNDYKPLQFGEAFDFMDQVNPVYVAAGTLRKGRQGFMVVELPGRVDAKILGGDDPHKMFGVLRTSHDRSRAVEVAAMMLRGKCMNQLTLRSFSANAQYRWAVRHAGNMHEKLKEAQLTVARLDAYVQEFDRVAHILAEYKVGDDRKAQGILERVMRDRPKRSEAIHRIIELWHGSDHVGFDGTGWGLVNAVSEYYEWQRTGGAMTDESRFTGALSGQTHRVINRTASQLLTLAA